MKISLIVCTYNRARSLRVCLASIAAMELQPDELIVVDNGSTDDTAKLLSQMQRVNYILEAKCGKGNALNAGVKAATGDVLAFTDDDVRVDVDWLHQLTCNLGAVGCSGAAGRILPEIDFEEHRPAWLPEYRPPLRTDCSHLAPLGIYNPPQTAQIEMTEAPFGANMAYRREVFDKVGAFRTDVGVGSSGPRNGNDTEFGQRVIRAGGRIRFERDAVVFHETVEKRLKQTYFFDWWYEKGKADRLTGRVSQWTIERRLLKRRLLATMARTETGKFIEKTRVQYLLGQRDAKEHQHL